MLGKGECTSSQKAGRDRRLAYPALPAHFSKEEKEAKRGGFCSKAVEKQKPVPGRSSLLTSGQSWKTVLTSLVKFHPLLATVRAAMLLKHLGIICITWPLVLRDNTRAH